MTPLLHDPRLALAVWLVLAAVTLAPLAWEVLR